MRKVFTTVAVLAMLVMGSAIAKAEVVEQWAYSISGIFVDWENDIGCDSGIYTSGATTVDGVNGVRTLSWGSNSNAKDRSVLSISSTESGVVDTNGPAALGLTLSHINKSISTIYRTLADCDLYLAIDLMPVIDGAVAQDVSVTILFEFMETPNDGLLQDDIFIITNPVDTVQNFMFDGQEYSFSFLASFDYLPETNPEYYAAYIDNPAHVYGWVTREDRTSCITTYLEIAAVNQPPVPEPSTMLLMGAGLAGLAFVNRRRQK